MSFANTVRPASTLPPPIEKVIPTIDDDAALLATLNKRGYAFKTLDELKNPVIVPAATEAERLAEKQKRVFDSFIARGGTEDEFKSINETLGKPAIELAKADAIREMISTGFTKDEAENIYKTRYYQADETDESFPSEIHKKYGEEKLTQRGERLKAEAAKKLVETQKALDHEDFLASQDQQWKAKAETTMNALEKKVNFSVVREDKTEATFDFDIKDEDLKEIRETIADPVKVRALLYNADNSTNLKEIAEFLVWKKLGQKMAVHGYTRGESEALAKVEAVYPSRPLFGGQGSGITKAPITDQVKKEVEKGKGLFMRGR